MKIKGKTFTEAPKKDIVILRGDEEVLFSIQAILNYDEFQELCPVPKPPVRQKAGGEITPVFDDPKYNKELTEWADRRSNWMFIKGLQATPDLEWESVILSEPDTWGNWKKEFADAGFTDAQTAYLFRSMIDLNGLDSTKIEKATKDFLATRELRQKALSSLDSEPSSTQSGEPASA